MFAKIMHRIIKVRKLAKARKLVNTVLRVFKQ